MRVSIKQISLAWETECRTHTQKVVLLALCDNANDEGFCWPSISTLARKCDLSKQGVLDQIEGLHKRRVLSVERTRGKSNRYQLKLVNRVDQSAALTSQPDGLPLVNRVDHHQSTALTGLVNRVDPNRKEPSLEPSVEPPKAGNDDSCETVLIAWNGLGEPFPKVRFLSDGRRTHLRARLKENNWRENWREAIAMLPQQAFATGDNDRKWILTFDFFIKPDSLAKILEGKYKGGKKRSTIDNF